MNIHTEESALDYILKNRGAKSIAELQKDLGFKSRTSIINRLKQLGIKKGNRKGTLSPLLEENIISYYWMGFILADGHFTKTNQLIVAVSNKDKIHLGKLAYFLNTEVKECKRTLNSPGSYSGSEPTYSRIAIQDKIVGEKIKLKFDISEQKTYNPPKNLKSITNYDLLLALIIGFIDGDGGINVNKTCKIECHSSWYPVLEYFKTILEKKFGISVNISSKEREYTYIQLKQFTVIQLKKFIQNQSIPVMERKWDKIK